MHRHRNRPPRQHGIAIVTALLITTLAVSAIASLFWHQQVQVRMMENQRLHVQAQWVRRAGLDWSREVLRDDRERSPELTTLDGSWNMQPTEIDLNHYFDRDPQDDAAPLASIASRIVDAQSRYNLTNLAEARTLNLSEIRIYERLLTELKLNPALALRTAQVVAASQEGDVGVRRQAALRRIDELSSVPGYTPQVLAALAAFVIVLPTTADLNLDTAAPELLAAVTHLPLSEARQLADRRRQAHFRTIAELGAALPDKSVLEGARVGLHSEYFLVESRIRLDRAESDVVSLLYRPRGSTATTELVWSREE
jgi:general secretion pathway protein K